MKKYPDEELQYYMDFNSSQIDDMAESSNVTRKELLKNYNFKSEKEFKAVNEDSSKLRIKQEMLVQYIADKGRIWIYGQGKGKTPEQFREAGIR